MANQIKNSEPESRSGKWLDILLPAVIATILTRIGGLGVIPFLIIYGFSYFVIRAILNRLMSVKNDEPEMTALNLTNTKHDTREDNQKKNSLSS